MEDSLLHTLMTIVKRLLDAAIDENTIGTVIQRPSSLSAICYYPTIFSVPENRFIEI